MSYRAFARLATFVFAGISAYTLVTKGAQGRLDEDWVHMVLHVVSASAGAYAGWAGNDATARAYTVAVAAAYLVLGVVGWFIDGFLLGTRFAVPLGPADNVFHLLLAAAAVAVITLAPRREVRRG